MRLFLMICAVSLSGCGDEVAPLYIPPDLLTPVQGWVGPAPETAGELMDAAVAEKRGRLEANSKLLAIADLAGPK